MKRSICFLLCCVWTVFLLFCRPPVTVAIEANGTSDDTSSNNTPLIILDAGHGGFDGGAVATDGTMEKDLNLAITLQLGRLLKISGIRVLYTRTQDTGIDDTPDTSIRSRKKSDMYHRLAYMNENPDSLFISLHQNKFSTALAKGAQVFYAGNPPESKRLGQCLQSNITVYLQPDNHRLIKQGTKDTFLLDRASVPAVIVECGFLSNPTELDRLKSPDYQNELAFTLYTGIMDYLTGSS